MSRYYVDRFMREVNMDPAAHASYVAGPAGFVATWIERLSADRREPPLTPRERAALETREYGALYELGAHPFLLWSFTEAVWIHEMQRPELVERFRRAAAPHGYPDFAT